MRKLTIITVVLNDVSGLEKTILSVIKQRLYFRNIEFIVIDGGSVDGSVSLINRHLDAIDFWVSESDAGIYDAMNKGLKNATGDGILFLNAGDYFVGQVLNDNIVAPGFLRVCYTDILGRFKERRIDDVRLGIPNCHQGILFEAADVKYDLSYSISADYKFYLDHGYRNDVPVLKSPGGYVYFDNTGTNGRNYKMRDREIYLIRKEYFGLFWAVLYEFRPFAKRFVRGVLKVLKTIGVYRCSPG